MFEIKLHINEETTLGEIRQFVKMCAEYDDDNTIAAYNMHYELDGIALVVERLG